MPIKTVTYNENEWRLVPVVATEEMQVAFAEVWFTKKRCLDDPEMDDAYTAMLEASPQPGEVAGEAVAEVVTVKNFQHARITTDKDLPDGTRLYTHPQTDAARDADARKAFALDALIAAGYVDQLKADEAMDLWPECAIDEAMAAGRGERV